MGNEKEREAKQIYFENLNSIRFIAAIMVIVHHIEQFKAIFKMDNLWENKMISGIGKFGVMLFFVLSGFLISYLLFKEKERTNTIDIKKFYIRRILRIWPLYFTIILLGFFVFPYFSALQIPGFTLEGTKIDLLKKLGLYVCILPNLVLCLYGMIPFVSQTWSIGAEEQFYLIWPVLNKKISNKWFMIAAVWLGYYVIKFTVPIFFSLRFKEYFLNFWASVPINCMAIGGLFAIIIFNQNKIEFALKKIIFNKWVQWINLFMLFLLIAFGIEIRYFNNDIYSFMFGIFICNMAVNLKRIFSLEYSILNYLGRISYGLYIYHPIAIVLTINILNRFKYQNNFILYFFSILLTVIIADISFRFFEKKFIDWKSKYEIVKT